MDWQLEVQTSDVLELLARRFWLLVKNGNFALKDTNRGLSKEYIGKKISIKVSIKVPIEVSIEASIKRAKKYKKIPVKSAIKIQQSEKFAV